MADLLAYGEDIIGFPGGEAKAKVKLMKLLWENPSPTSAFAAQNIALSSSDYDLLLLVCRLSDTYNGTTSYISPKGMGGKWDMASYASNGAQNWIRFTEYVNDTTINIHDGYTVIPSGTGTVNNSRLIPYQIYGIKLEQEIPVVAENVSTLAANCLLSDGETSVENKVDELTDYVINTTAISGVKITKMGHLVTLVIDKTITMNGSSWVSIGTVPYKPTTEIYGVAKKNADDKIIGIDLTAGGLLSVMGSGSSAILVRGSITYITND
jgi:hypothetical protein